MPAAAPFNWDDVSTAPFLTVPTSVRASGKIPYKVAKHSYREKYTHDGGSFQTADVFTSWDDANDFLDYAVGFTTWDKADATRFKRTLPMTSPFQSALHCESADLQEYGVFRDDIRSDSAANYWPDADWARYSLVFRHRVYTLATDAELDATSPLPWATYGCKELGRYVERLPQYATQELKLANFQLETYNAADPGETPQLIPAPGFVPFPTGEIAYVWHQVPYEGIPFAAIGECSGKVNDAAFDKWFNGTSWVDFWPAQTLLFQGVAERIAPVAGPTGELYVTLTYLFKYQPNGWNKFPQADPALAWKDVRRRAGGHPLYGTADFRGLFKPRVI